MTRSLAALLTLIALLGCRGPNDGDEREGSVATSAIVSAQEKDVFWRKYERDRDDIEKKWKEENGGRAWAGDYLAWKESFLESALVDMFVATRDERFLDELVSRVDTVFSLRDDRIDRRDEVRGKVLPAWGRFPDVGRETRTGTWVCEMVQNGLITYPIAELVSIVERSENLGPKFGEKAARYRDRLIETVDAFDSDWDNDGAGGFYRFPRGYAKVYPPHEGRYLPYNRALLMGRTMMALAETNIGDAHRQKYRERVRNMAKFFLDDAHLPSDGDRIVWAYAPWEQTVEDVAHGGLDTDFFAIAGKHAEYTNVGRRDIDRFIQTFKRISNDPTKMAGAVNGDGGSGDQRDHNEVCGRYLGLAAHDPSIAKRCEKVIANGFDERQAGYAKMLRYRRN